MTRQERLQRALKYGDFYELALLTYEGGKKMNIKINQADDKETLTRCGNRFFTQAQLKQIEEA